MGSKECIRGTQKINVFKSVEACKNHPRLLKQLTEEISEPLATIFAKSGNKQGPRGAEMANIVLFSTKGEYCTKTLEVIQPFYSALVRSHSEYYV